VKINLKIDPYNYPIILIVAFVIGFVVAIALGFGPQHGQGEHGQQIILLPGLLKILSTGKGEQR